MSRPRTWRVAAAALLLALSAPAVRAQAFLPDDPLARDADRLDVPKPRPVELSQIYDVIARSFFGRPSGPVRGAVNVNTLGEVPDSSWFTNRMGARVMSLDEVRRGPDRLLGPDLSPPVTVIAAKSGGITPGFTIRDVRGEVFFVKMDPATWPNLSTAADVIGTKFFHAFGYHVPENYIAYLRREDLRIDPRAEVSVPGGRKRPMEEGDLDRSLAKAARRADGAVRIVASRRLPGEPLGPFEYHGTRPDDANDVFPHEDRRELRGLRVFAAWLNHDDSRAANTQDMYVEEDGRRYVRHHLIDFASTLGSGSNVRKEIAAQNPRAGNEYILELEPGLLAALTLGFWERPWRKVRYRVFPEVGRFESEFFDPRQWRPEYPNPAFERMLPADAFWAARIVSRFTDEIVRALVHAGQFEDAEAEAYVADTLISRRDKIVAHYFREVSPLADFLVVQEGAGAQVAFRNLGQERGLGDVEGYEYAWFRFDNSTRAVEALPSAQGRVTQRRIEVPAVEAPYLMVRLGTLGARAPSWAQPVEVVLRQQDGWSVVGIDRGR
ncbi:MAG TPA: hypothetical protein VMR21_17180 [Vicinamibacteria bacterium]|nr:hypothetical protein [Vicinamibacteria bacterium]